MQKKLGTRGWWPTIAEPTVGHKQHCCRCYQCGARAKAALSTAALAASEALSTAALAASAASEETLCLSESTVTSLPVLPLLRRLAAVDCRGLMLWTDAHVAVTDGVTVGVMR